MLKGKKGEKPGFMALGGKSHMVPFVGDHRGQCTRALLLWSCPGWFRLCSLTCCAGPCLLLTIKNSIFSFFHRFYNSLFRETVSCPLQNPTVHLSPGMRVVTFPRAFARHGLAGVPSHRRACLPSCFSAWDRWHFRQTPPPP